MQIAICDDESVFREELKNFLLDYKKRKKLHIDIYEFSRGENFISSDLSFDIVFLDYQMPGQNGMETAKLLRSKNATCSIVFITNYPQFVLEAFEVQTYRFFIKPVTRAQIEDTVDNYIFQQALLCPLIKIQDGEQITINSKDIIYIEGDGKYCYIRTSCCTYHSSKTLSRVIECLPQHCFYRIHKSYAVNLYCISSIKDNFVLLNNGEKALIGRNRSSDFKSAYRDFVKNYYVRL